jgi:amino acid adenylation domain-containing protein
MLTANERRKVLAEWNQTERDYGPDKCLHDLIAEQAVCTPDAAAVICGDERISYKELQLRAARVADHLQTLGVGPGMLVALCVERSVNLLVGLLGILKAGGAYVPLDAEYPPGRLESMLRDSGAAVLLTQERLSSRIPRASLQHVLCLDRDWETIGKRFAPLRRTVAKPDDLAYVIYTSGSAGEPKGVMNEHRAVVNFLRWMTESFELSVADRVLQKTPISFDASIRELLWPLITGAAVVMAQPGRHKDPEYLAQTVDAYQITIMFFVPSMLRAFLKVAGVTEKCRSVRAVICGGEVLSHALQQAYFSAFDAQLHNLYGPTEAAIDVTHWVCQPDDSHVVPIGRPVANTCLYIVDALGSPVPIGVPGELCIGGVQVARGYWRRPELTAERFVADPFSQDPTARLYKTGDLCRYMTDGSIEYLGRIDHQVKVRGFRIELGEIEYHLGRAVGVEQAVVVAHSREDGEQYLVAYLVGEGIDQNHVRDALKQHLPDYMLPAQFVVLDALPSTANGKVDRKALLPPIGSRIVDGACIAPRTHTEKVIADLWSEALAVSPISADANFFDLGGHSLLAVQLTSQIRRIYGHELPLRAIFDAPVLADFAGVIDSVAITAGGDLADAPRRQVAERQDAIVASPNQVSHWRFYCRRPRDRRVMASGMSFKGVSLNALLRAFRAIVESQGALRTAFKLRMPGVLYQELLPADQLCDAGVRVVRCEEEAVCKFVEDLLADHTGFSLDSPPLFEFVICLGRESECTCVLVVDHRVFDGVSQRVFWQTFQSVLGGGSIVVQAQLSDYTTWCRENLSLTRLLAQRAYWGELFRELPPRINFPPISRRERVASCEVVSVFCSQDVRALRDAVASSRASVFSMFCAALAATIGAFTEKQYDILVSSHMAERPLREFDSTLGFLVVPIVVRVSTSLPVKNSAEDVQKQVIAVQEMSPLLSRLVYEHSDPLRGSPARESIVQVYYQHVRRTVDGMKAYRVERIRGVRPVYDVEASSVESDDGSISMTLRLSPYVFDACRGHQFRERLQAIIRETCR